MENHLTRTISTAPESFEDKDGEKFEIYASRTRNSHGSCVITLHIAGQRVDISNGRWGDDYQKIAFSIAEHIKEVANDSCPLPKEQSNET